MKKEFDYYKITGGSVQAAYERWRAKSEKNRADRKSLCEEFGATHVYANNVRVVGLVFENTHIKPVPAGWKSIAACRSAYKPSGNSKEMRELRKRFENYPQADALDFQTEVIGERNPFQFMDGLHLRYMLFEKLGDTLILLVPTVSEGDQHNAHCKNRWTPDAGCVPLKTSEYWALKESISETATLPPVAA